MKPTDEEIRKLLEMCKNDDTMCYVVGAIQAAAIGNAIALAENTLITVTIDGEEYPFETRHIDVINPIYCAIDDIINQAKPIAERMVSYERPR